MVCPAEDYRGLSPHESKEIIPPATELSLPSTSQGRAFTREDAALIANPEVAAWLKTYSPHTQYEMGFIAISRARTALVSLANADETKVTWSETRINSLNAMLDDLESSIRQGKVKRVIFTTPGKDGFIFGADLREFLTRDTEEEFQRVIDAGHYVFSRVRNLGVKTVAAVQGACVGGGLEFALNCDEVVACKTRSPHSKPFETEKTKFAFPEVFLGLFPGWGGTILAPAKIGLQAIDMILTGKDIYPDEAFRIGLVDRIAPAGELLEVAEKAARRRGRPCRMQGIKWSDRGMLADVRKYLLQDWPARHGYRYTIFNSLAPWFMGGKTPTGIAADMARSALLSADPTAQLEHPRVALKVILYGLKHGIDAGLDFERREVTRFIASKRTKAMVGLHFAETAVRDAAKGLPIDLTQSNVAVVGAGIMGGGITAVFANRGTHITVSDMREEALDATRKRVLDGIDRSLNKGIMSPKEASICRAGLTTVQARTDFSDADLVIEAVLEDLELKKGLLPAIEATIKEGTLLATNTSSKPVSEIATTLKRPENFCGIHFFNPAETMKLVEVVAGKQTAPETLARAAAFMRAAGKIPVVVQDVPGFLVNRVLTRYLGESQRLLAEGFYPKDIDMAGKHAGFFMGPLETLDLVGLDIGMEVLKTLSAAYGERMNYPTFGLKLVADGHLGRKSGRGFHLHPKGAKRSEPLTDPVELVANFAGNLGNLKPYPDLDYIGRRLTLPLVDEAIRCLDEGVAGAPGKFAAQQIDVAMVHGSGSLAMHAGPISFAERLGAQKLVDELRQLCDQTSSELYQPCPSLIDRAKRRISFYEPL